MKSFARWLWGLSRLAIGAGIVAFLYHRINTGTRLVTFAVPPSEMSGGAVYVDRSAPAARYLVLEPRDSRAGLRTVTMAGSAEAPAAEGVLQLADGVGPRELHWSSRDLAPGGGALVGDAVRSAAKRWPALAAALLTYLGCLSLSALRWRLILRAQGLLLGWGRTLAIVFIGQFFNAFMFGATGGDVVKALYAARATAHRRTEAAATVFVDRAVGMAALVLIAMVAVLLRPALFAGSATGRQAFALAAMAAAGLAAFVVAIRIANAILRRPDGSERLAHHRLGRILQRVHEPFHQSLTQPRLLVSTIALSVLNHLIFIGCIALIGSAIGLDRPFFDYLTIAPTVNLASAIPLTPGGLGLREFAAVTCFGLVGVPAGKALALALGAYATTLFWSLAGGLVFLAAGSSRGELGDQPAAEHR